MDEIHSDSVGDDKARDVFVRRAFVIAVILLVIAVASLQLWSTLAIRETQKVNTVRAKATLAMAQDARRAAKSSERATDRIEDCTTPKRACFESGQKRTGKVVGTLTQVQRQSAVFAAACADAPGTQTANEIEACVLKAFKDKPDQPDERSR